jgi:hypothetical protein
MNKKFNMIEFSQSKFFSNQMFILTTIDCVLIIISLMIDLSRLIFLLL